MTLYTATDHIARVLISLTGPERIASAIVFMVVIGVPFLALCAALDRRVARRARRVRFGKEVQP